jgi:hypothetical protein
MLFKAIISKCASVSWPRLLSIHGPVVGPETALVDVEEEEKVPPPMEKLQKKEPKSRIILAKKEKLMIRLQQGERTFKWQSD